MDEKIARLARMFHESENIVFFGGAGVSTASNIPDFRSSEGIFSKKLKAQLTPELLVSHTFYARYPEEFYQFYKENLLYPQAKPYYFASNGFDLYRRIHFQFRRHIRF